MGRCDQIVGLNDRARKFVRAKPVLIYTETVIQEYPDGHREILGPNPVYRPSVTKESSGGSFVGMFDNDEQHPLFRYYTFPGGRMYYEAVQDQVQSSGLVVFLALKDEAGNWIPESLWTEEEIQSAS